MDTHIPATDLRERMIAFLIDAIRHMNDRKLRNVYYFVTHIM